MTGSTAEPARRIAAQRLHDAVLLQDALGSLHHQRAVDVVVAAEALEDGDVVVEQVLAARAQPLMQGGDHHAGGRGVLVPNARDHDDPVTLFGGEHETFR